MNKTKLIAAVVLAGAAYAAYLHIHSSIIVKMFPDIDPKVVRKAHTIMVKRGMAGAYADMDNSDETMKRIFLAVVQEIQK
jgi:hypothetical protein